VSLLSAQALEISNEGHGREDTTPNSSRVRIARSCQLF
jgi:hypothetical protein